MHKIALVLAFSLLLTLPPAWGAPKDADANIKPAVLTTREQRKLNSKLSEVTKDEEIKEAIKIMDNCISSRYSYNAILGNNLTKKPVKITFKNLAEINPNYADYDALGMKNKGRLYIFINQKHKGAPPEALASLLSHEAMHQDEFNSVNEETYAWSLEAAVWTEFLKTNPDLRKETEYSLVNRLNTLNSLFVNANYTDKYIRKVIKNHQGYKDLPLRSVGFD